MERRSVQTRWSVGAQIGRACLDSIRVKRTRRRARAGFGRGAVGPREGARDAPVMVTVTVLDCPCGPAWGPDCCMSNAVGMVLGADRTQSRVGAPKSAEARAAETRAPSARDARGANARASSAERVGGRGGLRVGARSRVPCSGAGRFARDGAGLEKTSGRPTSLGRTRRSRFRHPRTRSTIADDETRRAGARFGAPTCFRN